MNKVCVEWNLGCLYAINLFSQMVAVCFWVMHREISSVSVGEQGKAMAPGQPPGEKCSPDTDNIQFLPCEMQKSTPTSAKCFIILYQILPLLSFCYTHLHANVHFLEIKFV